MLQFRTFLLYALDLFRQIQLAGWIRQTSFLLTLSMNYAKLVVEAKPLGLLVPVSYTRCRASTSGLSTQ